MKRRTKTRKVIIDKAKCFFAFCILSVLPYVINAQSNLFQLNTFHQVATGFGFTEGPVWASDGHLYFSDISGNTVFNWNTIDGVTSYLSPSDNANGIAIKNNLFVVCQHGSRQIARIEANGSITPLATHYNGLRLNSPNDLVVKSDGKIYFTDPAYGITTAQEELGFRGVYFFDENIDSLQLLIDSLPTPNGLAFSPDESKIYICDTQNKKVYSYDVQANGTLQNPSVFAMMNNEPDGIKIDPSGNVYVAAGLGGVKVFNNTGTLIDSLIVPEKTTNLCWGDVGQTTLFITSGTSVYSVEKNTNVSVSNESMGCIGVNVFPNPFTDNIEIEIASNYEKCVSCSIRDCKGRKLFERKLSLFNGKIGLELNSFGFRANELEAGVYILSIVTAKNSVQKLLIKN